MDLEASYEDILKRTNEEIESVTALIEVVNNNPALKVGAEKSLNKDFIKKDDFGITTIKTESLLQLQNMKN